MAHQHAIRVKDLVEKLQRFDPDDPVVIAVDEEAAKSGHVWRFQFFVDRLERNCPESTVVIKCFGEK